MSTIAPVTPYRSERSAGRDGFAQLVWAEWTKFRSVRGLVVGLIVGGLLVIGLGALTGAGSMCSVSRGTPQDPNPQPGPCPAPPTGPGGQWVTDSFYFVRQPLDGNGSVTARLTLLTGLYSTHGGIAAGSAGQSPLVGMTPGVQPWSKAGIIIKASTKQGSAYAAMMVTGSHGVRMQWDFTHDAAGLTGKVSAISPRWLRLTRSGDVISGYDSADGTHWSLVGTATLTGLPHAVPAGPFAASPGYSVASTSLGSSTVHGGPTLATGTFDDVRLTGSWPTGHWTGQSIQGATGVSLQPSVQGFTQAGGRLAVSGSGDIAPDVGDQSIAQTLAGTFAALIAMVVIGVMFITAEYRRGLIRTTFTAHPRRGLVLAAKAIVIAAVTFGTSLVAIAITIPVAEHLLRENGNPIAPVSWLTLGREVVGSAALLAVAAVLGLAVGALLRRSAGAITAVIAGLVLPYLLAVIGGILPAGASQWLVRVSPAAAFAVQQDSPQYAQVASQYTPGNGYFPLAPWAGFAVLCAWAAVALALAAVVLRRRDA